MSQKPESDSESDVLEKVRTKPKEPPRYVVLLHNDDYSTMEFVIEVLQRFFHKTAEDAARIMLEVHYKGKGVAGVYTLEIAETKVAQVLEYAKANSFPLLCTCEPE